MSAADQRQGLWELAHERGMTRRRFLRLLSIEGDAVARPTDVAGNTQPDRVPFKEEGYLFNQPLPHPIHVV